MHCSSSCLFVLAVQPIVTAIMSARCVRKSAFQLRVATSSTCD